MAYNLIEIQNQYTKNFFKVLLGIFLVILSLFFLVKLLVEWKSYETAVSSNVITLSGHGEVAATPDIAKVYFTIAKEAKTVKEAQDAVALIEKKALDFLKENNVESKDIQASNASFYPRYKYVQSLMPCNEFGCPPRPGSNVIAGYEASESITVKVRNVDDVGMIMQGLGASGVSDLSGPDFAVESEDALKTEARKKAIDDARVKAEELADDLGVKLGRIANFSETGAYYPMYSAKDAAMSVGSVSSVAPAEIPKGETTVSSDVTITYEIR